jgi:multidrug efflux system outer membrane protein
MSNLAKGLVAGALALSAAGCMVGPKYNPPQTKVDPAFANAVTAAAAGVSAEPIAAFWTVFNDPLLTRLVTESLSANHDVRQATARLREARALRRDAKYDLFPQTRVGAGYSATKSAKDSIPFPTTSDQRRIELFDTGFDSSWELDLWGRVRQGVNARTAEAEATAFDLRGVQVAVSAEVARSYYELRSLQRQLDVSQQNAENQRQTLEITQTRLDAGRGTAFDTERARTQLESTRAEIPALEGQIAASMHRIAVLTGRQPTALVQELALPKPAATNTATAQARTDILPTSVDVGSPEALLRRRPDIQSAERRLAEQVALVGVAVGDLFPRVSFTAGFGISGETPADLAGTSAFRYGIGPSVTWPAFNIGRVRARIKASEARTDGALARYEQTVLVAIEEVESSLVAFDKARARRERLVEAALASERAAELAHTRFEGGLTDFLQVLDAERTRLVSEEQVARSLGETSTSLVAVYKALGGGWAVPEATKVAQAATQP